MSPLILVAVVGLMACVLLKGLFSPLRNSEIALVFALLLLFLTISTEQYGLEKGPAIFILATVLSILLSGTIADNMNFRKERDRLKIERDRLKIERDRLKIERDSFKRERDTLEKVVEKHHKRGD